MVLLFLFGQREEVIRRIEIQITAVAAVDFPNHGLAQALVVPEKLSLADELADVLPRQVVVQRPRCGQRSRLAGRTERVKPLVSLLFGVLALGRAIR